MTVTVPAFRLLVDRLTWAVASLSSTPLFAAREIAEHSESVRERRAELALAACRLATDEDRRSRDSAIAAADAALAFYDAKP